jgi:hypothetical protein
MQRAAIAVILNKVKNLSVLIAMQHAAIIVILNKVKDLTVRASLILALR